MDGVSKSDFWYYGLIPLAVMIIGTYLVYHYYWRDIPDIAADVSSKKAEVLPAKGEADAGAEEVEEEVESA